MDLKSTPIFSILVLIMIPSLAFATPLTDDQVMAKYSNPNDLQNAINNCQINYNDIPSDIQVAVKDSANCQTQSTQNQISNGQQPQSSSTPNYFTYLWLLPLVLILGIVIIFIGRVFLSDGFSLKKHKIKIIDKSSPKTLSNRTYPKNFIDNETNNQHIEVNTLHKLLLMIGILKVKKQ